MAIRSFFRGLFDKSGGPERVNVDARYEFLRDSVSGTMSSFRVARDRETGQVVGLKVLDKEKTEHFESRFPGLDKPTEGTIATQFSHPHIVKTLQHGSTTAGEQFLVMEFLDGPGLNSLIIGKDARLEGNRLRLMQQAAEALDVVHKAGFIHRDVCPRNFVCTKDATSLKLIDFGLTVPAKREYMLPGNRTGTPNYMAPEIARRKPTDQRVDIFAFGASMYEMFCFDLPWPRGVDGQAAMSHGVGDTPPLSSPCPWIHPEIEQVIHDCLAGEPSGRPDTMETVCRRISRIPGDYAPGAEPA